MINFIRYILIGLAVGFVAGKLMRGSGLGFLVNLIVGIVGGVLGGWLFSLFGFEVRRKHYWELGNFGRRSHFTTLDCVASGPKKRKKLVWSVVISA